MIRRPPRSTLSSSSAASDVYKRQKEDVMVPENAAAAAPRPSNSASHAISKAHRRRVAKCPSRYSKLAMVAPGVGDHWSVMCDRDRWRIRVKRWEPADYRAAR